MILFKYRGDDMSRRNNQNNQYNGNQYNGSQYYNGNNQYYNQNGQYYNQNGQYYNQNGQYYNQNGQYYNQRPNQNPNQGKIKSNKFGILGQQEQNKNPNQNQGQDKKGLLLKVGAFAVLALIVLLIVFAINSCGKKENTEPEYDDTRVVGQENLGYVTIPSDWVTFKNQNPIRGIQYSDINGEYILTLESLSTSQISAREYALGTANNLQNAGISVQGAEVQLGKYNAFQIYGQASNNVWVLVYFFEAEDGYTHYVGVEGPDRNNEAFKIPETFKVKKES